MLDHRLHRQGRATDDATHQQHRCWPPSITSIAAGVDVTVLPGAHTYAIVAKAAGHFEWICVIPCDSDAPRMGDDSPGYMAGYITAT